MALCTSCSNQVEESASFCTSCGKPMPAAAHPSSTVTATRPVCSSCGAQGDPGSLFCTECGKRMDAQPAPVAEAAQPVRVESAASADPGPDPISPEPMKNTVASSKVEAIPTAAVAEQPVEHEQVPPAPQVAAPLYAAPSDYPPAQPGGGAFRLIVLALLLLIVVGGFGGWYFMGVETVIVCSPPDVRVFLDGKELAPESYGRYVIPHLSRQSHLLKVQRPGFADTIQRLDFSLASLHEWVNIKLVRSRQLHSPSRQ